MSWYLRHTQHFMYVDVLVSVRATIEFKWALSHQMGW